MAEKGPPKKAAVIPIESDPTRISKAQLAEAYQTSSVTVGKRIKGIEPLMRKGTTDYYRLRDVCDLKDVRELVVKPADEEQENISDPDKMAPDKRRLFYQAEDLRQAAELKARKNAIEAGKLLEAAHVERVIAEAFKTMALTLDTLPDLFERDGLIQSSDVQRVIEIVDSSRNQLANDLSNLSPVVEQIEAEGDWG